MSTREALEEAAVNFFLANTASSKLYTQHTIKYGFDSVPPLSEDEVASLDAIEVLDEKAEEALMNLRAAAFAFAKEHTKSKGVK